MNDKFTATFNSGTGFNLVVTLSQRGVLRGVPPVVVSDDDGANPQTPVGVLSFNGVTLDLAYPRPIDAENLVTVPRKMPELVSDRGLFLPALTHVAELPAFFPTGTARLEFGNFVDPDAGPYFFRALVPIPKEIVPTRVAESMVRYYAHSWLFLGLDATPNVRPLNIEGQWFAVFFLTLESGIPEPPPPTFQWTGFNDILAVDGTRLGGFVDQNAKVLDTFVPVRVTYDLAQALTIQFDAAPAIVAHFIPGAFAMAFTDNISDTLTSRDKDFDNQLFQEVDMLPYGLPLPCDPRSLIFTPWMGFIVDTLGRVMAPLTNYPLSFE